MLPVCCVQRITRGRVSRVHFHDTITRHAIQVRRTHAAALSTTVRTLFFPSSQHIFLNCRLCCCALLCSDSRAFAIACTQKGRISIKLFGFRMVKRMRSKSRTVTETRAQTGRTPACLWVCTPRVHRPLNAINHFYLRKRKVIARVSSLLLLCCFGTDGSLLLVSQCMILLSSLRNQMRMCIRHTETRTLQPRLRRSVCVRVRVFVSLPGGRRRVRVKEMVKKHTHSSQLPNGRLLHAEDSRTKSSLSFCVAM